MKVVCTRCGVVAQRGTTWCQNSSTRCPPDTLSRIYDPGDAIEDITILSLLAVLPASAVYRARRGKQTVLLKIAHRGQEDTLKQEAKIVAKAEAHPAIPRLVAISDGHKQAHGKLTVQSETHYFCLFEDFDGTLLRRSLMHNAQQASQFTGQFVLSVAEAIAVLHRRSNLLLLSLSPDTILVRTDAHSVSRPLLVDFSRACRPLTKSPIRTLNATHMAYLAPEELRQERCTPAADVYKLALLMYEMLVGEPAFPHTPYEEEVVKDQILSHTPRPLRQRRPEISGVVSHVVEQGMRKAPDQRPRSVRRWVQHLLPVFGVVEPERPRGFHIQRRVVIGSILLAIVLLLVFLLFLALSIR